MRTFAFFTYRILLFFAFLGVVFIPFSFRNWNFQSDLSRFFFEDIILFLAAHFERIDVSNPEISSDSTSLYLLFLILFVVAIILVTILSFFAFWKKYRRRTVEIIQLTLCYYLACIMLRYGFDKIFKAQFYLPEPNTLYTPLGMLDKDILYWSTMGTSHSYNVFMGLIEVIPALMLLHKKTRNLGLFILSGVLLHIVYINFSFDISVKLFSSFLLLINLLLLAPSFKKIFDFFVLNSPTSLPYLTGKNIITSKALRLVLKAILILFFFAESLLPYIKSGQYNDDNVARNYLHGAYDILAIDSAVKGNNLVDLKRFFIHRYNYFIFQYDDDTMEDFHLEVNPKQNQFILTNYEGEKIRLQYKYSATSRRLEIKSDDFGWVIYSKELSWRNLPLMQPLFHWTVDEI